VIDLNTIDARTFRMVSLHTLVWRALKSKRGTSAIHEICDYISNVANNPDPSFVLDINLIKKILDGLVAKKFITEIGPGIYRINIFLMPVVKRLEYQDFDWGKIQRAKGEPVATRTGIYESPYLKYMPMFNQAGRGTCVGHSGAFWMMANYFATIQETTGVIDAPTPEDVATAKSDQYIDFLNADNSIQCRMLYDAWYRTVLSPQCCYEFTRETENATYPEGACVNTVPKAMRDLGICEWQDCLTPKTNTCTPHFHPLSRDEVVKRASAHRIKGWAMLTNFTDILNALASSKGRFAILALNLWEDYGNPNANNELKTHFGEDYAGSHAVVTGKVDFDKRRFEWLTSWGSFVRKVWITEAYWKVAGGPVFIPIDDEEIMIGRMLYSKVAVSSNIPCWFSIDGESRMDEMSFVVSLEREKPHRIVARPRFPAQYKETELVSTIIPMLDEESVAFSFTRKADDPVIESPKPTIREKIAAIFAKIWASIKKK
jgi:hypothetical protein